MPNDVKTIDVANNYNNNNNPSSSMGNTKPYESDDDDDADETSLPSVSSLSSSSSDSDSDSSSDTDSPSATLQSDSSQSDHDTASIVHGGGPEAASEIDTDDFLSQDPLYLVLSQFFLTSDKKHNITGVLSDLVDRLDKLVLMLSNKP